jgi:hypothetical protein
VCETECTRFGTAVTAHSHSDVFPAPDGADTTTSICRAATPPR